MADGFIMILLVPDGEKSNMSTAHVYNFANDTAILFVFDPLDVASEETRFEYKTVSPSLVAPDISFAKSIFN
jgi:hypothetical protein